MDYNFVSETQTIITDNFGRSLTLDHKESRLKGKNEIGPIHTITDSAGQVTNLTFDGDDMITSVTYPGAQASKVYSYEGSDNDIRLVSITDELGIEYAKWSYDGLARGVLSSHHNDAEKTEIEFVDANYDDGEFTSITKEYRTASEFLEKEYQFETFNGAKKPVRITEQNCSDCTPSTTQFEYTPQGMLDRVEVLGGSVTDYNYSAQGNLTRLTEAVGTSDARTTNITWHRDFNVPTQISAPGSTVKYTRDSQGNVLIAEIYDSQTATRRETTHTYNSAGQVLTVDGPRTDVSDITEFEYAANGDLVRTTNALGHVTEITQHDSLGRAREIIDPNGTVSSFVYDLRGWLDSVTVDGDTTLYTHNDIGLMTKMVLPNGVELNYEYDTARRLAGISDGLGNRIEYTVDLYGNRTRTDLLDPNGVVKSHVEQAFNNLGQLINSTGAHNQQQTWSYDVNGNVTSNTDELGLPTESQFDALQRVTQQVDPAEYATQYEYNTHQQISKVIDATGKETTYKRNVFGDVTEQISPDTGRQLFTYDSAGNLLTSRDARNIVTTYSYDALNRMTSVSFADSVDNITYSYDDISAENKGLGRLTSVDDDSGSMSYRYDAKGQVISETRLINGIEFETQYRYDQAGLVNQVTYPSGRVISYLRNLAGQIQQVSENGGVLAQSINYLPFGPVESITYGNGLQLNRAYDQSYRVTRNQVAPIFDQSYTYTTRNNISSINDALGQTQTYAYDALQRLEQNNAAQESEQYAYDAIGNRLTLAAARPIPPLAYEYSGASHRLKGVAPILDEEPVDNASPVFATTTTNYTIVAYNSPVGEQQLFSCSANPALFGVLGSDIYTTNSYVCAAAVHAGVISAVDGGLALIEVLGPQDGFVGSHRNGVNSRNSSAYANSYHFLPIPESYTNVIETLPNPWSRTANVHRTKVGEEFIFGCPPDENTNYNIYGTDTYLATSSVCTAGVHAGLLDRLIGGELVATIEPDPGGYIGTTQNGITSLSAGAWYGAYSLEQTGGDEDLVRYRYDASGNAIQKGSLDFTYDQLGRMKTAASDVMSAQYVYDANNLRAQKTVDGVTTVYLYDLNGLLIAESDAAGNIQREYVYVDDMRLAMFANGQRYYIHSNHLDAPQALTDSSGALQWQADIAAFGEVTTGIENVEQNLRFPGQYFDAETGLHYNWHRYYDPEIGRYIQSDPIGLSDGPSTYGYVGGNPVNHTDSTGLYVDSVTASCMRNPALCAIIGNGTLEGGINLTGQVYNNGWSCVRWDEVSSATGRGMLWGAGFYGAGAFIGRVGGRFLNGLGRGFGGMVDDVSRNATKGFVKTVGRNCVYSCTINGITRYVGITNNIARRGGEHLRSKGIIIQEIRGLSSLSRADARAVEQTLIHFHGLGKNGGTLINKINSISATKNTTVYENALLRGRELLRSVDYPGFN